MEYPQEQPPKTPKKDRDNDSDADNSDNTLEIDLDIILTPRKSSTPNPSKNEQDIIETIEDEIDKQLCEKAEKTKLTVTNVKTIIRQVLRHEHVLALIGKGDIDGKDLPSYEPKLTRAKAKELLSSNTISPVTWVPQPPTSETQVLVGEDLQEDDSGDEYVPGEEESEDDKDESVASESEGLSLPPPTPPTPVSMEDSATQTTSWTDDGVFKIPQSKTPQEEADEAANIALRTRSKINLSSTPLKDIEKKFVPPDIPPDYTTEMYDMDCDDDEWMDFLKGFTEPLEEVTKPTEDEDHDPEYNIMADDEINKVDREDFRIDKAVKITKKEVKELWEELFEYLQNISDNYDDRSKEQTENTTDCVIDLDLSQECIVNVSYQDQNQSLTNIVEASEVIGTGLKNNVISEEVDGKNNGVLDRDNVGGVNIKPTNSYIIQPKKKIDLTIGHHQIYIIEQQMRQHVQMLTQNFLLTYEHPEFHHYSVQLEEYLLNLKFLSDGKRFSLFRPVNLIPALKLIDAWISLFAANNEVAKRTKLHVQKEVVKSIQCKMAGNWTYVATFPQLVLETISKSDVFLYPSLLPKIPFKSKQFRGIKLGFTDAEDSLIVFGLDEFSKFLKEQSKRRIGLKDVVVCMQEYIMPHRAVSTILKHINKCKHPRCATNPIQQYILHKKVKPVVHYIYSTTQIVPPCKRSAKELPFQWRNFIHPPQKSSLVTSPSTTISVIPQQVILINSPFVGYPALEGSFILPKTPKSRKALQKILPNPKQARKRVTKPLNTTSRSLDDSSTLKRRIDYSNKSSITLNKRITTIEHLVAICLRPVPVQKLIQLLVDIENKQEHSENSSESVYGGVKCLDSVGILRNMPNLHTPVKNSSPNADKNYQKADEEKTLPNMPSLNISIKNNIPNIEDNAAIASAQVGSSISSTTIQSTITVEENNLHNNGSNSNAGSKKVETVTSSSITYVENKKEKRAKSDKALEKSAHVFEFSMISSSSFQQADTSTEVEFCRNASSFQICQTLQSDKGPDELKSSGYCTEALPSSTLEKDNLEDINALLVASSTVKPNVRKEPSGAEKKKTKLRKEFVANLSIAAPEDPESYKNKNEMFAIAYYDKLRETLELDDYHKIMQILNEFESGDVIDLFNAVQGILQPKYTELADEFLYFLKEKEAAALGQLIPWLEIQARSKFLRKLEIYFKDQPAQLRKIYNSLMELTQSEGLTIEKIKGVLLPMLKGNTILIDLFLQNFRCEGPPPSLLEGPYETIDIHKEMARQDNEEIYEKIVVANTEDKYGGHNCVCFCHKIEDNAYKTRYKHCKSCGLRFIQGNVYVQTGRGLHPATISFKTNPNTNHNMRLLGKPATVPAASHRKKRSDRSPSKQVGSSGKENVDEDTEDEELGKRKAKSRSKSPRKRKKVDPKDQETVRTMKKSPGRSAESNDNQKESAKPRKRTYSGKKSKKTGKMETEEKTSQIDEVEVVVEVEENKNETNEEQERLTDDCVDSDFNGSGESLEKPLTPGQQTAESESEIYCEESSQDNYESDSSSTSMESNKGSQSDNTNDEPPWQRTEDTVILETFQKEDDKEYAVQIISDKLPNRTTSQIRARFSTLMALLIDTLNNS